MTIKANNYCTEFVVFIRDFSRLENHLRQSTVYENGKPSQIERKEAN